MRFLLAHVIFVFRKNCLQTFLNVYEIYVYSVFLWICIFISDPRHTVLKSHRSKMNIIHENNVLSRSSPQWLCANSCTWAHVVRLHIAGTNEPKYIYIIYYIYTQAFIQVLLTVAIFTIKIKLSNKGGHPQDKCSCNWGSRGLILWFCAFKAMADVIWVASRGQFCMKLQFQIGMFGLFWVSHRQLSSTTTEIKITPFEDFETFKRTHH